LAESSDATFCGFSSRETT